MADDLTLQIQTAIRQLRRELDDLKTRESISSGALGLYARLDAANVFTIGPQTVQTGADGNKGIIVQGTATQTANAYEYNKGAGAITYIDSAGALYVPTNQGVYYSTVSRIFSSTADPSSLVLRVGTNNTVLFQDATPTSYLQFYTGNGETFLMTGKAAYTTLLLKDVAAQTGALLEFQDSSANQLGLIAASGAATFKPRDAGTAATLTAATLGHNSSGTPAAGYGTRLLFQGESSTTENRDMAAWDSIWTTATDASRTALLKALTVNNAAALAVSVCISSRGLLAGGDITPDASLHAYDLTSTTNAVDTLLLIQGESTGTTAAGFGSEISFLLEDDTNNPQRAMAIQAVLSDAASASLTSYMSIWTTEATVISEVARFDNGASTSTYTSLMLWDVDTGTLARVTVGAANSGGAGFKLLRLPN